MGNPDTDAVFAGSLPQVYQKHLVPLIFAPYAGDLVLRLKPGSVTRVLEMLQTELALAMGLSGMPNLASINRSLVQMERMGAKR